MAQVIEGLSNSRPRVQTRVLPKEKKIAMITDGDILSIRRIYIDRDIKVESFFYIVEDCQLINSKRIRKSM
jgi:hypothetical protein